MTRCTITVTRSSRHGGEATVLIDGLNLQDHPLSVQREVRDALAAAMRAMKGEDLK